MISNTLESMRKNWSYKNLRYSHCMYSEELKNTQNPQSNSRYCEQLRAEDR